MCGCVCVSPVLAAVPMGTRWVPFCVMAFIGSWCCPSGACCTMVTVVRGAAWELWMMRLTPPIDEAVMDGTGSTLTTDREKHLYQTMLTLNECTGCTIFTSPGELQWRHESVLTFDLLVLSTSILLRFCAHCSSGLSGNGCHSDSWDLVDNVHRLHDGGGANWRRYYGWCRHGIGHRLHGRLRHLALHGDQYWLVVEGGAYQGAGLQVTDKLFTVIQCLKNGQRHTNTVRHQTFFS